MAEYDMQTYWGEDGKLYCGKHRTTEFRIYWINADFKFVCAKCENENPQPKGDGE